MQSRVCELLLLLLTFLFDVILSEAKDPLLLLILTLLFVVILSEGGLPRVPSSAGNPSRRTPLNFHESWLTGFRLPASQGSSPRHLRSIVFVSRKRRRHRDRIHRCRHARRHAISRIIDIAYRRRHVRHRPRHIAPDRRRHPDTIGRELTACCELLCIRGCRGKMVCSGGR